MIKNMEQHVSDDQKDVKRDNNMVAIVKIIVFRKFSEKVLPHFVVKKKEEIKDYRIHIMIKKIGKVEFKI